MALGIDSETVLRAIIDHPSAFSAVKAEVDLMTGKLFLKQLKHKAVAAAQLKAILEVVGEKTMSTALDDFSDNELAGLLKKVDPHSGLIKEMGDPRAARQLILGILAGRADASAAPIKEPKAKAPKAASQPKEKVPKEPSSKIGKVLGSKVHAGARPKPVGRTSK